MNLIAILGAGLLLRGLTKQKQILEIEERSEEDIDYANNFVEVLAEVIQNNYDVKVKYDQDDEFSYLIFNSGKEKEIIIAFDFLGVADGFVDEFYFSVSALKRKDSEYALIDSNQIFQILVQREYLNDPKVMYERAESFLNATVIDELGHWGIYTFDDWLDSIVFNPHIARAW